MIIKSDIAAIMTRKNAKVANVELPDIDAAIDEAETAIRTYCGFDVDYEIPQGLKFVWAETALNVLSSYSSDASSEGMASIGGGLPGVVKSIKEGDISVEFAVDSGTSSNAAITDVIGSNINVLNLYRKLYGVRL